MRDRRQMSFEDGWSDGMKKLVVFDLETGGLDADLYPVIQIGAVALHEGEVVQSFERKLRFDTAWCDPGSLEMNSYVPEVWEREAIEPAGAWREFAAFMKRHAGVKMISKKNKPYWIAQMVGWNVDFDMEFMKAQMKKFKIFMPASYRALDAMQRMMWLCEETGCPRPENYKLTTVHEFVAGVKHPGAHGADVDAKMTVDIMQWIWRTVL